MIRSHLQMSGRRSGNILIVTLLLLALFATIGLTIVYYTKDLAERSRIGNEAQSTPTFSDDGTSALNAFLAQLIYEPTNTSSYLYGQSLLRAMYGGQTGATTPWNGVGSFHESVPLMAGVTLDRAQILNYGMVNQMGITGVSPETSIGGVYIPKNAPYTYPDLKDFYLASICPATGEVLVPSFHRYGPAAFGSLASSNPNWTSAAGMFLTPRPVYFKGANANFPYPPANADGTITGDVQNLPGGFFATSATGPFVNRNDSIWVDIGLPPMTLPNGKIVKQLVAVLIADLDGLLNYSVTGNVYSSLTGGSGTGVGPWEINLARALPTDGLSLINGRGVPQTASGIQTRSYNPRLAAGQQLPAYGAVAWNTGAGAAPVTATLPNGSLNLPGLGGNSFYATSPFYTPTATAPFLTGYDSTNAPVTNPGILFNPAEWPTTVGSSPRSYPLSDLKQLMARAGASPSNYAFPQLDLNQAAATSLRGTSATYPFPYYPQPGQNTPSNYRLDPANLNRAILTPYSWSLDMPGLNSNYPIVSAANALTWTAGTSLTGGILSGPPASTYTPIPGTTTALGPIDLNRPLADYRLNTGAPLSPTNMAPASVTVGSATVQQAVADRQQFAMSIFARLVVASGGLGTFAATSGVGESVTISATAGTPQFYALQALAQLAANIVDYIDADDVSTAFVWNPINPADPLNPANFASAAAISNSVVFGVEKPRLLLNEAYGEVVNDPNDPTFQKPPPAGGAATKPQIRFWLELVNPTNSPYTTATSSLGTGAAKVRYTVANDGVPAPYSAYTIQIVRSDPGGAAGINVSDVLRNPANANNPGNVTGGIVGTAADLTFDFSAGDTTASTTPAIYTVLPSNGVANTPNSLLICAANVQQPPSSNGTTIGPDFIFPNANINGTVNSSLNQYVINGTPPAAGSTTSLTYNSITLAKALPGGGANGVSTDLLQHVVLLRRLANPYLLPNDPAIAFNPALPPNPYITVDYMDYVPAADRILRASGTNTNRAPYNKGSAPTGFNPLPASIGKVQPCAGWTPSIATTQFPAPPNGTYATGTYPFAFPTSLVLPQKPTTTVTQTPAPGSSATAVQHTFCQYNSITPAAPPGGATYIAGSGVLAGGETIMTPFDWLTHLDRPLLNQTELFEVSMGKPHELTLRSIAPNTGNTDVSKFSNTFGVQAGFTTPITTPAATVTTNTLLYRALDLLRVQPYGQMTALGGRVPGRININTIQDKRVWDALFDAQSWNTFTQTDVQNMWTAMIGSRTATMQLRYSASGAQLSDSYGVGYSTPVPGQSVYDTPGGAGDRPFLPFGAPTFTALPGAMAYSGGSGLFTDTLARNGSIFAASNPGTHPYQQGEALRKIMNNTTTVSHTFAVWVTVGYFNVTNATTNPVQLGSEYYSLVPGDLRKKFFTVVDRSLVGLTPGTTTQSQNQPFFTTIDGTSSIPIGSTSLPITTSGSGQISINGTLMPLPGGTPGLGNTVAVGVGATQEVITLVAATSYANGVTTYTVVGSGPGGGFQFPHWPGESVSNIVPGNPGPQSSFSFTQTPYSYVVPYWSRVP